jgi:hypothetical protein
VNGKIDKRKYQKNYGKQLKKKRKADKEKKQYYK